MSQKPSQRALGRTRLKLGGGALMPERNIFARRCFFLAVSLRVPKAIAELSELSKQPALEYFIGPGCFDQDTELALQAWANRWGLPYGDSWWMEPVRRAVRHWRERLAEPGCWPDDFFGGYRAVEWPSIYWPATEESADDFRARVEQYIADIKATPGVRPTPLTFTVSDFEALAIEQLTQKPLDHIPSVRDASNTRKRNRQLAELMGLPLRRRRPGRPTKNRRA